MRVPQYKRITKTDHPEMPEWAERVFDGQNRQMESLTTLAQGNVTFGDNFSAEVRTVAIPHFPTASEFVSVELQILKRNPIGVVVLDSSFFEFWKVAWRVSPTSPLTVDVKMKWDSVPDAPPDVTLLFIGA